MTRDLDLIRQILFKVEEKDSLAPEDVEIDGHDEELILYHCLLLREAGFIDAVISFDAEGELVIAAPTYITWSGWEFLSLARNDDAWESTRRFLKDRGASVSVAIIKEVLAGFVSKLLGLP